MIPTPQELQLLMILRDLQRGETVTLKPAEDGRAGELLMIITRVTKEMVELHA